MMTFEKIRELALETQVVAPLVSKRRGYLADTAGRDVQLEIMDFATAVWKAAEEHHIKTGQDRILGLQAELTLLRGEVQLLRDALISVGRKAVS